MNTSSPFIALETQLGCIRQWIEVRPEYIAKLHGSARISDADLFSKRQCGALYAAVPYFIAPDIEDLLAHAATEVPDDEVLELDQLPDDPMWLFLPNGIPGRLAHPSSSSKFVDADGTKPVMIHQILVYKGMSADPEPVPLICITSAGTSGDQPDVYRSNPYMSSPVQPGITTVGEWRELSKDLATGFCDVLSFLISFLRFTKQKLIATTTHRSTRAEARRVERSDWSVNDPVVRVVQLRSVKKDRRNSTEPDDRHYSCRWIVRGHWHPYWCGPGGARRELRWLLPHVAGPPDAPLKASTTTLYAVVR